MDTQIVVVFCLVDDMLKGFHHQEEQQCVMGDAEVMSTAIIAALYFGGNYTQSCKLLQSQGYIPRMLSKSRFSRRLHLIKPFFLTFFSLLDEHWKSLNEDSIYSIDTTGSLLTNHFPKKIHATSASGYELKLVLFVLACSFNFLF